MRHSTSLLRLFSFTAPRALCLLLASLGALHGANAQEAAAASDKARMRVFGQNGITIDVYENSQCVGGNGRKTRASGGVGDAFSSFFGSAKNTSIGMTETPTTANLGQRGHVLSKAFFHEYEVAANQPVSLNMHFMSAPSTPAPKLAGGFKQLGDTPGGASCSQFGGTFTPEPGKEYEVTLEVLSNGCLAVVQEIRKDEQQQVGLTDVALQPTAECH